LSKAESSSIQHLALALFLRNVGLQVVEKGAAIESARAAFPSIDRSASCAQNRQNLQAATPQQPSSPCDNSKKLYF